MEKRFVIMWYTSVALFGVALIDFFYFMFNLSSTNVKILIALIAIATVMCVISTNKITHPKGFTAIQAIFFYKACKKEGISKPESCRKKSVKFKEVASRFEFTKNLTTEELLEVFTVAYDLYNNK